MLSVTLNEWKRKKIKSKYKKSIDFQDIFLFGESFYLSESTSQSSSHIFFFF